MARNRSTDVRTPSPALENLLPRDFAKLLVKKKEKEKLPHAFLTTKSLPPVHLPRDGRLLRVAGPFPACPSCAWALLLLLPGADAPSGARHAILPLLPPKAVASSDPPKS